MGLRILVFALLLAATVQGDTLLVDQAGGGDYLTIQEAVDVAGFGDEILIMPGIYYENVDFPDPTPSLTVRGTDPHETVVDAGGQSCCFYINDSSGCSAGTIEGLCFASPGVGTAPGHTLADACVALKAVDGGGWTITDCIFQSADNLALLLFDETEVTGNLFRHNDGTAIYASSHSEANIHHNTFVDCSECVRTYDTTPWVEVSNNIFYYANYGIRLYSTDFYNSCNCYYEVAVPYAQMAIPGDGDMLDTDPEFCGPTVHNYFLQSDSPCGEDAGVCGRIGAFPEDCGPMAAEGSDWSRVKALY